MILDSTTTTFAAAAARLYLVGLHDRLRQEGYDPGSVFDLVFETAARRCIEHLALVES